MSQSKHEANEITPATDETNVDPSPTDLEQGVRTQGLRPNNAPEEKHDANQSESQGNQDEKRPLEPSAAFTGHQKFYIFVLDGVGGMALSGGVNFAIAYAMYTTQDTTKHPIRLFQLPNTLAGDAAVTIIVQCILTWFVEMGLVQHDLGSRSVQPIGFVPEPSNRWLRWFFFLPPLSSPQETSVAAPGVSVLFLVQQALRGFLIAILGFIVLWPIGIGALTALGSRVGGDYVFSDRWTPQVFKLLLGGLLGLLTTPLMAMFWLIKAGWEQKPAES